MGIILFIVAVFLFLTLFIPGILTSLLVLAKRSFNGDGVESFFTGLNELFFASAIMVDVLGNVLFQHFFNLVMIYPEGYKFGRIGETISSALGKNQRDGTLTPSGTKLCSILDYLDKDHCKKSIQEFNK